METMTIKVDASAAVEAIRNCLKPGVILLTEEVVNKLYAETGVGRVHLERLGGVVSDGYPS